MATQLMLGASKPVVRTVTLTKYFSLPAPTSLIACARSKSSVLPNTLAPRWPMLHEVNRRMAQYVESEQEGNAGARTDAGLKSRWVNVVEGGAVNSSGVLALARQLNLPAFA